MTSFRPAASASSKSADEMPDAWASTRAQTALATQFLKDEDDYLASPKQEIGRQTGVNQRELFVSCAPDEALQQQFEHLRPDFIAVHDVATAASRKLLAGVAAAFARPLQKLVIRRQGYGTPLATLDFVELATADGGTLRMYSTDAEADAAARAGLARTLLGHSRLGVLMLGDVPAAGPAEALQPLHDDIVAGPWTNRHLLLLPLAAAAAWVRHGAELALGSGVTVRTTPLVARPADAWNFIHGSWGRLREQEQQAGVAIAALATFTSAPGSPPPSRPPTPPPSVPKPPAARAAGVRLPTMPAVPLVPPSIAAAPALTATPPRTDEAAANAESADTQPMPLSMRPMPKVLSASERAAERATTAADDVLDRYVRQLADLNGVVSCCVFDTVARRAVAHAGASPGGEELARHGIELLQSMSAASRSLGLGHAVPDAAITLGNHHLLLRAVPKHPGMALHAVLDKTHANLTLARLQIQRLDSLFDESARR